MRGIPCRWRGRLSLPTSFPHILKYSNPPTHPRIVEAVNGRGKDGYTDSFAFDYSSSFFSLCTHASILRWQPLCHHSLGLSLTLLPTVPNPLPPSLRSRTCAVELTHKPARLHRRNRFLGIVSGLPKSLKNTVSGGLVRQSYIPTRFLVPIDCFKIPAQLLGEHSSCGCNFFGS